MTERLVKKISRYFVKIGATKIEDIDVVAYGLFHIIADSTQILILILLGLLTNSLIEILVFTIFYGSIKKYSGGYHLSKHYLCVIAYTSVVFISLILTKILAALLMPFGNIFLAFLSFVIIFLKAPIPHPNNPKSKDKLSVFRKKAVTNATIEMLLIIIMSLLKNDYFNTYITVATFGGLLASITLLIPINIKVSDKPTETKGGGDNESY